MSEDKYTEVTHQSWGSRLSNSIKGILAGLVFFILSFPLLFWNEGRSVERHKSLEEGGGSVISIAADNVNVSNEGKLVFVKGKADTKVVLNDAAFGVSVNAIKLKRVVETYQWKETSQSETKKKLGGGTETTTTYSYNKVWSEPLINSANFKRPSGHQNPGSVPFESTRQVADNVTLGAFTLSSSLVGMINNYQPLPINDNSAALMRQFRGKARVYNSGFYIGSEPSAPQVGDMRIKFFAAKPTQVSIIAGQVSNTFEPYFTKVGGSIELLQIGTHSAQGMIKQAQESNKVLTWILRVIGFVLMMVGLNMMFSVLSVFADVLPILGDIVGAGTGLISFLVAAILSLITIAIAWIFYRPLLAIILIAIAVGLFVLIKGKLRKAPAPTAG